MFDTSSQSFQRQDDQEVDDWNGVLVFYSRDPSFMSLIDSPLFVKFPKMVNFNFRES
jgi:hypothetical protein